MLWDSARRAAAVLITTREPPGRALSPKAQRPWGVFGNDAIGDSTQRIIDAATTAVGGTAYPPLIPTQSWAKRISSWSCVDISWRKVLRWFDVSQSYQAIECLSFGCTWIFGPFPDAPTTHDVTQDSKLFVVDGDGFCHLTAPMSTQNSTSRLV